jgi:hypothetical protein
MVIEFISLLLTMAELLFLFLKGMTGALVPFSYLVFYRPCSSQVFDGNLL